jgi:integrase
LPPASRETIALLCAQGELSERERRDVTIVRPAEENSGRWVSTISSRMYLTFLVTQYGAPFSAKGFGEAFRGWCSAAGLPRECTAHGLRKACARRLAEAGCNPHEIMSITGHKTLAEVERYTRAVDRERLVREAAIKLVVKM